MTTPWPAGGGFGAGGHVGVVGAGDNGTGEAPT